MREFTQMASNFCATQSWSLPGAMAILFQASTCYPSLTVPLRQRCTTLNETQVTQLQVSTACINCLWFMSFEYTVSIYKWNGIASIPCMVRTIHVDFSFSFILFSSFFPYLKPKRISGPLNWSKQRVIPYIGVARSKNVIVEHPNPNCIGHLWFSLELKTL